MKRIYTKLIVVVMELLLAVSVAVMSSYAWMVLSSNPAVEGFQITIGGGNTILVAADLQKEVDGVVYHYPDAFRDTLNLAQHKSYQYLNQLGGLTPVSTADGINWFLPTYYDMTDEEVLDGQIPSGTLKDISEFTLDDNLNYANLTSSDAELAGEGGYMYLDFWVTSPGEDYTLRVSTGEDESGSFVIGLPRAEETENGYTLVADDGNVASCIRVGFLVNSDDIIDNTMKVYQNEPSFSQRYRKLRGIYTEAGESRVNSDDYRFTVYEPNGDARSNQTAVEDGSYVLTEPIGLVDGQVRTVSIRERLTVQKRSVWTDSLVGTGTQLEQRFQTALMDPKYQKLSAEEVTQKFYKDYLSNQVSPYVERGAFVRSTQNLYNAAVNGIVWEEFLAEGFTAGATDDVYIVKLEKDVPQRIRLFIWIEGEDVDCVNSAAASAFAFRIELAGSNMDT